MVNQQKDQFRSAYEAGRQAYQDTTKDTGTGRTCRQFFPWVLHPKTAGKGKTMDHLAIWIMVTSFAVLLQACVLLAMYVAIRKTSAKVEGLSEEVKTKVLPTVDLVHNTITDLKPRIETIVVNVSESSTHDEGTIATVGRNRRRCSRTVLVCKSFERMN